MIPMDMDKTVFLSQEEAEKDHKDSLESDNFPQSLEEAFGCC